MTIDQLRELFEAIRDENRMYANTATRVGNAFLSLLDFVSSFSSDKYLRKDIPDSTRHLLSLLGGAVFGEEGFAAGMSGFGARIDEGGNGEMESLVVRRFLEVPELRYNRVDVSVGDKWRAPGGGVIESVDTEAKTVTLKLEDGEIGAVAAGDICMGIYHAGAGDATADSDDGRGNRTFAGFTTVYFTITEVLGERNEKFRYQLRPASERWTGRAEPLAMMRFVAYGNFTDEERQTSVCETRTYTRMLWRQNTWEIGAGNVAMQQGDLSNLSVFGIAMEGYSAYLNNVYFTGTVTQVKPDGTPMRTANDRGEWQAGHYDYYDRVSHNGRLWLCVAEGGTTAEPSEGNADWLLQVDKGGDGAPGGTGAQGASMSWWGEWKAGVHYPYLAVVRYGKAAYVCTVEEGTDESPAAYIVNEAGLRLTTKTGAHLLAADGGEGAPWRVITLDGMTGPAGARRKTTASPLTTRRTTKRPTRSTAPYIKDTRERPTPLTSTAPTAHGRWRRPPRATAASTPRRGISGVSRETCGSTVAR